ncbi:O-antigen ligase family protein [Patescibacteria group bacterium]|nr:O-antigen ligase family protein [Patescibacteria group bacterium]MBU1931146.1 O-antigen ligase family protein [Patescibacteria group bacterium]
MNLTKTCNQIITYSFYALFFLVPLILSPWNFELFEFSKMLLVYSLTIVITAAWLIKMLVRRRINFQATPLAIPLLIFFASQLISTVLSIEPHTSIWGYYSRSHGGLLSTISYLLLYWAFVSNMSKKTALSALHRLLGSAALIAGYGILEHFGIDAQYWVQDVRNRVFSTLGQPNWLAAWLVALIPLTWVTLNSKLNTVHHLLFAVYYICLLYTKSRSGILAFAVAYIIFWGITLLKRQALKQFLLITGYCLLITILIGTPYTPNLKQLLNKTEAPVQPVENIVDLPAISESGDIRKVVWRGTLDVWKHWPVFGSGVETFAYSYYNFRPQEHNDLSEWDFLYNKAHNEYLNFLATTGIVGLTSYLLLIIWTLVWMLKKIKMQADCRLLVAGLFTGYSSILVSNFFGFSVVTVALQFFLYPALVFVLTENEKPLKPKPCALRPNQIIAISIILLIAVIFLFRLAQLWRADFFFSKGKKLLSQQPVQSYIFLEKATTIYPSEAFFHNTLADSAATLALAYHQQLDPAQEATPQASQASGQATQTAIQQNRDLLVKKALQSSQKTLELNPVHLNFYKTQVKTLITLASINPEYNQVAIQLLEQAIRLAPTDAKLYLNLGLMQGFLGQNETAISLLEKTIDLKPDYAKARRSLAQLYHQNQQAKAAIDQLNYVLERINPTDEEAQQLLKDWSN